MASATGQRQYDVLIHGYIAAYARVAPTTTGSTSASCHQPPAPTTPAIRYTYIGNGIPAGLLDGEKARRRRTWPRCNAGSDCANHDCAGIRSDQRPPEPGNRFDSMNNHTRLHAQGRWFGVTGADAAVLAQPTTSCGTSEDGSSRPLLNYVDTTDPDPTVTASVYLDHVRQQTDYGNWTNWSSAGMPLNRQTAGPEPTRERPWRGDAPPPGTVPFTTGAVLDTLNLVVERGQAQVDSHYPGCGDAAGRVLFASAHPRRRICRTAATSWLHFHIAMAMSMPSGTPK